MAEERTIMSATRRAIFAGAAAIGAGTSLPAGADSGPTEGEILSWASKASEFRALHNLAPCKTPEQEAVSQRYYEELCRYEAMVMRAPCVSDRVAAAKLRLGAICSLEDGERPDKLDLHSAMQVVAFLEAKQ